MNLKILFHPLPRTRRILQKQGTETEGKVVSREKQLWWVLLYCFVSLLRNCFWVLVLTQFRCRNPFVRTENYEVLRRLLNKDTNRVHRERIKNLRFGDEGVDQVVKRDGRSHCSFNWNGFTRESEWETKIVRYPFVFKCWFCVDMLKPVNFISQQKLS